jgi:hypothetical protein
LRVEPLEDRLVPALSATTWTPVGPAPISAPGFNGGTLAGRVSVAAPDTANPNVMFIGADHGGIWKTTDWLDPTPTWTPLTDDKSSLSFTNISYQALVLAPGSESLLYAAVAGPGGGILKSTDAGATWQLLGNGTFNTAVFGTLAVSPTDPNTLFVTVWGGIPQGGGVYRSTDGGQTWTNTTSSFHKGSASDVAIDPTNPSVLYAGLVGDTSANPSNGVYKSTDGGQTWIQLGGGILNGSAVGVSIRLALAPSAPQTVYATVFDPALGNAPDGLPHRFVTKNGGTSWTALTPLAQEEGRYWHAVLAVDPTDSQTLYVNGPGPLYQSTDGGTTWTQVYAEDPVGGYFDSTGAFVLVGDRGIYRWTGPGALFTNKQGNLQITEFYTVTPDPTDPSVVYGIAQDEFRGLKSSGSTVWNYLGGADEVGRILVNPANPQRLYTYDPLNSTSFVQRSDDAGLTWTNSGAGINTAQAGFGLAYTAQKAFVMDPTNPARLLLGTSKVYETTNSANSWKAISPDLSPGQFISALGVAASAPHTVYAATADGKFFATNNDGATAWQERDIGLPNFPHVMDIQVDPTNPNLVFVVLGSFANSDVVPANVWMTPDGGSTWEDITGNLPALDQTLTIAVDWRFATPVLYVGTNRGAYRSIGTGGTWVPFGSGLPNTVVSDLELVPQQDLLVGGTYGRGAFEILVAGQPAGLAIAAPAGAPIGTPVSITVSAVDAAGNQSTAYTGTVQFSSTDLQAGLPNTYTFTAADNGSHTFSVTFKTLGPQTVTVMDTGTGLSATSSPISVTSSTSAKFGVTAPAAATAGTPFDITVTSLDAFGNPNTAYRGTVEFGSDDVQATLPDRYQFTAADNGVHTFTGVILRTAGPRTVTALDLNNGGLNGSAPVAVSAAAASQLAVTAPPGSTAGAPFDVTVAATDPFGNLDPNYRGTLAFDSDDHQATLPPPYQFNAADAGKHTFTGGVTLRTAGTRTLTVTSPGLTDGTAPVVVSAAAAHLALTVPSGSTAGTPFAVTVAAVDAFGNTNTAYRGVVRFTSTDLQATLPAGYTFTALDSGTHTFTGVILRTAGSQTVTVADTANGQAGAPVAVSPAAATHLALSAPADASAGTALGVTVTALDPFGNTDTNYQGTVSFASDDSRATLPGPHTFVPGVDKGAHTFANGVVLRTAGSDTLTVSAAGLTGATATVAVSPAASTLLLATSVNPTVFGQPLAFTASVVGPDPALGTPSGTVAFMAGDAVLAVVPVSGGQATFTTTGLPLGANAVSAAYSGDNTFAPGTAAPLGQVVVDQPMTDVTGLVSVGPGLLQGRHRRGQRALLLVNGSGRPLEGPISLVLTGLGRKAKLVNATGMAAGLHGPYVNVVPAGGVFAAGQALPVTLVFRNPTGARLRFGIRVVAGVGPR